MDPKSSFIWADPLKTLTVAIKHVPAVKWAMGVLGVAAAVAVAVAFFANPISALAGTVIMIFLMILLFLFSIIMKVGPTGLHTPAIVLVWAALGLVLVYAVLITTAIFFEVPRPFPEIVNSITSVFGFQLDPSQLTATYTLEFTVTLTKRSPPQWTPWGTKVRIPKLGHDGSYYDCTDQANRRDVCVSIPADSVPVFASPGVPRVEPEPADRWGSWCDGQRPDAVARVVDNQVCKPYWNWRHSESHFKRIRLLYEELATSRESKRLVLEDPNGLPAETLVPGQVYSADLTDAYASFSEPRFDLLVRRSDGLKITATHESSDSQRLFVSYDEASQKYQVRLESDPLIP